MFVWYKFYEYIIYIIITIICISEIIYIFFQKDIFEDLCSNNIDQNNPQTRHHNIHIYNKFLSEILNLWFMANILSIHHITNQYIFMITTYITKILFTIICILDIIIFFLCFWYIYIFGLYKFLLYYYLIWVDCAYLYLYQDNILLLAFIFDIKFKYYRIMYY